MTPATWKRVPRFPFPSGSRQCAPLCQPQQYMVSQVSRKQHLPGCLHCRLQKAVALPCRWARAESGERGVDLVEAGVARCLKEGWQRDAVLLALHRAIG